jgi:hypothetical protein
MQSASSSGCTTFKKLRTKLPGGIPLKLKSLVVLTVLALAVFGCSAAFAQGSATLGYTSAGNLLLYCNYEQIQWGGANNFYSQGVDNNSPCGLANNGTMEGVKVAPSAADAGPVTGAAYSFADNTIDAQYGTYSGLQWFVISLTKPSKLLGKFGWAGYIGEDGYEFLGNYGYLTATIPTAAGSKITASGAARQSQTRTKTISSK